MMPALDVSRRRRDDQRFGDGSRQFGSSVELSGSHRHGEQIAGGRRGHSRWKRLRFGQVMRLPERRRVRGESGVESRQLGFVQRIGGRSGRRGKAVAAFGVVGRGGAVGGGVEEFLRFADPFDRRVRCRRVSRGGRNGPVGDVVERKLSCSNLLLLLLLQKMKSQAISR